MSGICATVADYAKTGLAPRNWLLWGQPEKATHDGGPAAGRSKDVEREINPNLGVLTVQQVVGEAR